jgi:hypothetical protein
VPLVRRFEGPGGRRALWLLGLGMLLFGLAELPALVIMSTHGTGVLGFERAGSTHRLNEILLGWGTDGRGAAEAHVFIDLGFIACYGLLLIGACGRLASLYGRASHRLIANLAGVLAWGGLFVAAITVLQKLPTWPELHGHTAQPFPALASLCAAITSLLAIAAVIFSVAGAIAARLLGLRDRPEAQPG